MNMITKTRTNYFRVTDAAKFKDIIAKCATGAGKIDVNTIERDGETLYSFSCSDSIDGLRVPYECKNVTCDGCPDYDTCDADCEYEYDEFTAALSKVVAPNDAILITTISYEGLRTLCADTDIITSKAIRNITLQDLAFEKARELLDNADWTTQNFH